MNAIAKNGLHFRAGFAIFCLLLGAGSALCQGGFAQESSRRGSGTADKTIRGANSPGHLGPIESGGTIPVQDQLTYLKALWVLFTRTLLCFLLFLCFLILAISLRYQIQARRLKTEMENLSLLPRWGVPFEEQQLRSSGSGSEENR